MRTTLTIILALSSCAFGLRADINHDGRVDIADLSILASEWLMEEDMSLGTDFNGTSVSIDNVSVKEVITGAKIWHN